MNARVGIFRPFVLAVLGFALFMAAMLAVVGELERAFGRAARRAAAERPPSERLTPPSPRLQADPDADLLALQREWTEKLQGYAWVDKPRGLARVPIGRAMQLMLRRGFPTRGERR